MIALVAIGAVLASYLLGAIPFGLLVARRYAGIDVRAAGSGNIGATNVARTAGKKLGALVLLLDALKGLVPTLLARLLWPEWQTLHLAVGASAIVGHVLPVYLKFQGGKGVATALGVFVVLLPYPTLAAFALFAVVYALTRMVSLGSILGVLALNLAAFLIPGQGPAKYLALAAGGLILWRHRGNMLRLWRREESKL